MADRLTQLQDTINQVWSVTIFFIIWNIPCLWDWPTLIALDPFHKSVISWNQLCVVLRLNLLYVFSSKLITFAIALVFCNNIQHQVNSQVLIAMAHKLHSSNNKKVCYFHCWFLMFPTLRTKNLQRVNFIISDYAHLFATLIARCAKDIDVLIESLPSEDSSTDLQVWDVWCSTLVCLLMVKLQIAWLFVRYHVNWRKAQALHLLCASWISAPLKQISTLRMCWLIKSLTCTPLTSLAYGYNSCPLRNII
jgi:hypothetical protein